MRGRSPLDLNLLLRSTLYVVVLTVLLGGAYPAAVWAVSQVFWKDKANGSFVTDRSGGRIRIVGSELIGQNFRGAQYLHPRPSAAG
jgi:K+-transporting ATPase ATPase C chain